MEFFQTLPVGVSIAAVLILILGLAFVGAPLWAWTVFAAVVLFGSGAPMWAWGVFAVVAIVLNVLPVRRAVLSGPMMGIINRLKLLPVLSPTQQVAIDAGSVWVEAEFFGGRPDYGRLRHEPYAQLSAQEQAFLDGPVEELCAMISDWEISREQDLPEPIWEFLKTRGFWGLIVPRAYGGHEFTPVGNSAVIAKIASRSVAVAVTVMVPNSLGPAELLLHYGTQEQRDHYLPRLCRGEEVPCFALTEPRAGSDAGAISSSGVVFAGDDGQLYLRLNWQKRYITLAAVSTVLGLAFDLRDPDNLLGRGEELGITCALIPTDTEGVILGRRHDPLGVAFVNSPTEGHGVVVPIDAIIGGPAQAGNGWRMLTESLAEGRGVSLPAQSTGAAKLIARVTSAYASVREQFGLPIGRFEGIEEPLARIAGTTYLMEAARRYTCGGIVSSGKPAVVSAIAKYTSTELLRQVANDGMDIVAGAGISRGPRNLLSSAYISAPIGITVEGANILTRTLIIYGQGLFRSHPYVLHEIEALRARDVPRFDRAIWSHVGSVFSNGVRSVLLSLTRGYLSLPPVTGPTATYYRRMTWSAATFALLSDVAMGSLGGTLQRREMLTGRFADALSWMYLGMATLRRFEAEGYRRQDLPMVRWAMDYSFAQIQDAFDGVLSNFPGVFPGALFRGPIALWSRLNPVSRGPSDAQNSTVARLVQQDGPVRDDLTAGIYVPSNTSTEQLARLELAFHLTNESRPVYETIANAVRDKLLPRARPRRLLELALETEIISPVQYALVLQAEEAREQAITVDAFAVEGFPSEVVTSLNAQSAAE